MFSLMWNLDFNLCVNVHECMCEGGNQRKRQTMRGKEERSRNEKVINTCDMKAGGTISIETGDQQRENGKGKCRGKL